MAELEEGRVIGSSYRVVRCIGQGGMGTVYEVEHVELGVHYALKTFTFDPTHGAREILKTKFLEEGKVLARLKHPNIAHVFDLAFDEETQMPYFVMDLVTYEDGESYTAEDVDLSDIDEEVVYGWFKQLASALDYIHEQGIVHQDIKPGNLLLDKDTHVILTDFGISHVFGAKMKGDVEATRTMVSKTGRGTLVRGTDHYIAPEVKRGDVATPGADAYSLGVMVLRWLTGFFYDDNPGALGLLGTKKYRWIPVIARLLAPTPDRRPKTYSDLVKQLKPIADGRAASTRPSQESAGQKAKKKRSKTRENIIAAAIGLFIVGLVAGAGWLGYRGWLKYEADKKANAAQLAAIKQRMRDKEAAEAKEKAEAEAAAQKKAAEEKAKKMAPKAGDARAKSGGADTAETKPEPVSPTRAAEEIVVAKPAEEPDLPPTNPVFTVTAYMLDDQPRDFDHAREAAAMSTRRKIAPQSKVFPALDFNEDKTHLPGDATEWFFATASAKLTIREAGAWTFAVRADDGCRLVIWNDDGSFGWSWQYDETKMNDRQLVRVRLPARGSI